MMCVTLDPRVLVPPAPSEPAESFETYVATLLDWKEIGRQPLISLSLSRRAVECLQEDGRFPLPREVERVMRAHGIEEYDFNTLRTLLDSFYHLDTCLEDRCGCDEVLYERWIARIDLTESGGYRAMHQSTS